MTAEWEFSRREVLVISLAAGGALLAALPVPVFARSPVMEPTPEQGMGPFYPVVKPADRDSDLTSRVGTQGIAKGQILHLGGRIFNPQGKPQTGVEVEIWQANAFGRYTHPLDKNTAPRDPNFEGYGVCVTNAEGRYGFKTIKPAPYPAATGWTRPPHIHFQVTGRSARLVTQMYFPGEPLNEKDRLFRTAGNRADLLIAKLTPDAEGAESGALLAAWDIVLPGT